MGYLRVRVGFEFVYRTPTVRGPKAIDRVCFGSNILNPGKKYTHIRDMVHRRRGHLWKL